MKKINIFLGIFLCLGVNMLIAQETNAIEQKFSKHEIGFTMGAFPVIGILSPPKTNAIIPFEDPVWHIYNNRKPNGNYEKMYHLGSFSLNYNYHFNTKQSIGVSLSWVGIHVDTYWIYYDWSFTGGGHPIDTVNGSGWKHYFTLQGNYRNTYYRKNKISFYWGVHAGITLCVRDRDILPKEFIYGFMGNVSNVKYYFTPALHLNAFGIEMGEKNVFNMELGIGTQGIAKIGYKYKF